MHSGMEIFLLFMAGAFLLFMGLLSALLLWKMYKNEINLATILNESNGDASVSRFQLLLFSMVVAIGLFLFMLNNLTLPDIPNSILVLLGISASTYAAGKGISFSRVEGIMKPGQIPPDGPPMEPEAQPVVDPSATSPVGGGAVDLPGSSRPEYLPIGIGR